MASNSTLTLTDTTWAQCQTIDDEVDFTPGHGTESAFTQVLVLVLLPFIWQELVSRLDAIVNGPNTPTDTSDTRFGDVCVNFSSMEVSRSSGEQIALTAQEFKTLKFFVLNPGRVISRDELLNQAWGMIITRAAAPLTPTFRNCGENWKETLLIQCTFVRCTKSYSRPPSWL